MIFYDFEKLFAISNSSEKRKGEKWKIAKTFLRESETLPNGPLAKLFNQVLVNLENKSNLEWILVCFEN